MGPIRRLAATLMFLFCLTAPLLAQERSGSAVTAILGSMPPEIALLKHQLTGARDQQIMHLTFTTGNLAGRPVVLAVSGNAKVNAAVVTTLLIEHFHPRQLIFTGIAGALDPDLRPGDIVIGASTVQHDLGDLTEEGFTLSPARNPLRHQDFPLYFTAPAGLRDLATSVSRQLRLAAIPTSHGLLMPRVRQGRIATGDQFVASAADKARIRKLSGANATEMEGAAVAQVCDQFGVPCLVIRSISDSADARAGVDYRKFRNIACENSARLVLEMLKAEPQGPAASLASANEFRPTPAGAR